MRRVFRNAEGELRLVWIWLIGIVTYYLINSGIPWLLGLMIQALPTIEYSAVPRWANMGLLPAVQFLLLVLTLVVFIRLHRRFLCKPLRLHLRPLLVAGGAMLAGITAAILLLSAMGKLQIVTVGSDWVGGYGEYLLLTAIFAADSLGTALAGAIYRYAFLFGSARTRLGRRRALLLYLLLYALIIVLGRSGTLIRTINNVLMVALLLLAFDVGGAGACCGVLLGASLGIGVIFGWENSIFVLLRAIQPSSALIAPNTFDLLTGGGMGSWESLWLTGLLLLSIAVALLFDAGVRAKLRVLLKRVADARMGV